MNQLRLLFIALPLLLLGNIYAQDARSILDKASEAYNKAGGIKASFTLDSKDLKANITYSYDGYASMQGNKFKIEIPDAITWFNGTTQWVYIKDTEEVNISTPTGDELQSISPAHVFSIYKSGFNLTYLGEKTEKGKKRLEVELTPQKKNGSITKIVVQIDSQTNIFSRITMFDSSGLQNILTVTKLETGLNLPDNTFSFSKSDYPNAEVVDLR